MPLASVRTPKAFSLLVGAHLQDDVPAEELQALSGGYAARTRRGVLEPGCCCDLSDLPEWQRAVQARRDVRLGIGHAVLRLHAGPRATAVLVEPEQVGVEVDVWVCSTESLGRQLEAASRIRRAFQERLACHLAGTVGGPAAELAAAWVGA